jgi:hypothetical protein
MALMIPPTIHPSVRSGGERRIFEIIRDAPNTDSWICLHSLGLARHCTKRRGEIDFVLLTRTGVFALEVKSGRVARKDGLWVFTDRYGVQHHKSEGPFEQASKAMFALEEDVRRKFGRSNRLSQLLFGYGVIFPDIHFDSTGCEGDGMMVYDVRDRRRPFQSYIDRLGQFTQGRQTSKRLHPTADDIKELVKFLRGDFDLVPPLTLQAEDACDHLLQLTEEQSAVMDDLYEWPRCLIQGPAGTGKTLLAARAARQEARAGRRVLLLCYNRNLGGYLSAALGKEPGSAEIVATSVHQFMEHVIRGSSLYSEFRQLRETTPPSDLYSKLYPEFAQLALLESCSSPFQTFILDEGQDVMTQEILDFFDSCLHGGLEAGRWRVFFDANNQAAVYGSYVPAALERLQGFGRTYLLTLNCRNTRPIAEETAMLAAPKSTPRAKVDGVAVEYSWSDDPNTQPDVLAGILDRLLRNGVPAGRITVLSPLAKEDCCAVHLKNPNLQPVTPENAGSVVSGTNDGISYATVSSFKGLENDFIVLTDVNELTNDWWQSVIYVGMSRARFGLHLILDSKLRKTYEDRLRERMIRIQAISTAAGT